MTLFPAGPLYIIGAFLLALVYWTVLPRRLRGPFLLALSLGHAAVLLHAHLLLLLALILAVHLRLRARPQAARQDRPRDIRPRLAWTVAVPLAAFAALKTPPLIRALSEGSMPLFVPISRVGVSLIAPLGLSYCLFRLIDYAVEVHRGRFQPGSLADLTLYVLFFPTFRAGPIERFRRFQAAESLTVTDVNEALGRILLGLAKKCLVADLLLAAHALPWLTQSALPVPLRWLLLLYGLTLLVYMDFAGYSDIAIGVGRLFGYRIMENFRYPLFAPNIAEFWRRWHISLHEFIRDDFFLPLFGRATSLRKMLAGVFLSFVLSQLWHAFTVNFLLLGAYHGVLLVGWSLIDRKRRRRRTESRAVRVAGIVVTFHLVALGFWLFFWGQVPGL